MVVMIDDSMRTAFHFLFWHMSYALEVSSLTAFAGDEMVWDVYHRLETQG